MAKSRSAIRAGRYRRGVPVFFLAARAPFRTGARRLGHGHDRPRHIPSSTPARRAAGRLGACAVCFPGHFRGPPQGNARLAPAGASLKNLWPGMPAPARLPAPMKSVIRRAAALLFVFTACSLSLHAQTPKGDAKSESVDLPDPVAVVEGEKISRADLQDAFNNALASSGMNAADLTAEQKMAGYREILDQLIIDKLVSRKASSVEIKDADLEAEIKKIKGQFPSEDVFKSEMTKAGVTETAFRDDVKRSMQQQTWMKSQIADKDKVADADVKKFYDENKKEFEQPELVRASHILIRIPEGANDEVVAEKKKAAEAALERVTKKKEDFTAVAKEVSEEPGAKESGGDLNFFPKERMVPEFANAAFALKEGEISKEPVKTQFGWHVIKVTGRKAPGTLSFDESKEQIKRYLEEPKRREIVRGVIESIRSEAKVENKLPAPAPSATAPAKKES
ncbi:MAG: hypothetical protein FGM15_07215 [Chthoniobacterales bacterium]|nr:hypothetical protein [Chthoniobacterales bacterium]